MLRPRRRPSPALAAVLVLAVVAVVAAAVVVRERRPAEPDAGVRGAAAQNADLDAAYPGLPAPDTSGESFCTDPVAGREWRVTWRTSGSSIGLILSATGFFSRAAGAGAWTDESLKQWELRWSTPPLVQPGFGTLLPQQSFRGVLGLLTAQRTLARFSPRFVTPDGACTAFAVPFATGTADRPAVAVIGDSLVGQLGPDGDLTKLPLVTQRLAEAGDRVEVNGQGGRRWTPMPNPRPGMDGADQHMRDEIRGLRGADVQVIALGTNDAGWVSMAKTRDEFDLRLAWVLLQLDPVIDEIAESPPCTVLVTGEDRGVSYLDNSEEQFAEAARGINDLLRERANEDPADDLHVLDWAGTSAEHHTGDPDPWFGEDTIHLNDTGRSKYAEELAKGADLCR